MGVEGRVGRGGEGGRRQVSCRPGEGELVDRLCGQHRGSG